MYDFKLINPSDDDWRIIEGTYDGTVYKTKAWFDYLAYQNCKPFIAEVHKNGVKIGYFVGELIKRGMWQLGSPLEGVGTGSQGLSMLQETSVNERIAIYKELADWVFKNRYAAWFQVEDWQLTIYDFEGSGLTVEYHDASWVDLTADEDTMFARMDKKSCRYKVKKAIKEGVVIRETEDPDKFLDVHFDQCKSVMRGKGLEPLRPKEHLRELIKLLYPKYLLLLEAVSPDGTIVSTGIYAVSDKSSCSFSSGSYREYSNLCANELIRWEAFKRCKARGASFFNNNGCMEFKLKFGVLRDFRPRIVFSRYKWLFPIRNFFKDLWQKIRFTVYKIIRRS